MLRGAREMADTARVARPVVEPAGSRARLALQDRGLREHHVTTPNILFSRNAATHIANTRIRKSPNRTTPSFGCYDSTGIATRPRRDSRRLTKTCLPAMSRHTQSTGSCETGPGSRLGPWLRTPLSLPRSWDRCQRLRWRDPIEATGRAAGRSRATSSSSAPGARCTGGIRIPCHRGFSSSSWRFLIRLESALHAPVDR